MLEMNPTEEDGDQRPPGLAGGLPGGQGGGPRAENRISQGYYEHDYERLMAALKKNSKKLAIDPARREPGEALKVTLDVSMGKPAPLRELTLADGRAGPIDAMVYRLYALTEEEIGTVE
jgi:hypothetical protein